MDALNFLNDFKNECELTIRSLIKITKIRYSFPDNWMNLAKYMIKS